MKITNKNEKEEVELRYVSHGQCFLSGVNTCMRVDVTRGKMLGYVNLSTGKVYYSKADEKVVPVEVEGVVDHAQA